MSEYLTYEEWLNQGNSITDITGEALASALLEKFFDRYIGWEDSTQFKRYYRRNLNIYISRYKELMRIEPGQAKYDWAAQDYHRIISKRKDETINHGSIATDGNDKKIRTGSETRNYDLKDTDKKTESNIVTDTTTYDTQENHDNLGHTKERTGGHTENDTGNESGKYSGKAKAGTYQDKKLNGTGTKYSGTDAGHTFTGGRSLDKSLPMSQVFGVSSSYDDTVTIDGKEYKKYSSGASTIPTDSDFKTGAVIGRDKNGNDVYGDFWTTASAGHGERSAQDQFTTYGQNISETGGTEHSQSTEDTNSHEDSGTHDNTKTFVYNNELETENEQRKDIKTGKDQTVRDDQINNNGEHTHKGSDTLEYGSVTDTGENHRVTDNSNTENANSNNNRWETGRHEAPADILNRAVGFIEKTNAFQWLCEQIDSCFLAVYEV